MSIPPQSGGLRPPSELFATPAALKPLPELVPKPAAPTKPAQTTQKPAADNNLIQRSASGKAAPSVALPQTSAPKRPAGKELAPGVYYDTSRRTPDGGVVRILSLDPRKAELVPVFKSKGPVSAREIEQDKSLIGAVNASFFGKFIIGDIKAGGHSLTDDKMPYIDKLTDQRHFVAVTSEGGVTTGKGGITENPGSFKNFIGGFPALYSREQLKTLDRDIRSGTFNERTNYGGASHASSISRSFLGVKADGSVLLVAAGEGNQRAKGVSLPDGARLLRELGAVEAYVLDGGGSTTMFARGVEHARTDGREVWSYLGVKRR